MRFLIAFILIVGSTTNWARANDFGPADFPGEVESGMPLSVHDAWCKQLNKECKVKFQGRTLTVEGYKGISREQLLGFRSDSDGKERYFYVKYINSSRQNTTALFLFVHKAAAAEFGLALSRWYEQDSKPYPNYRYPNSQGPQDSQGK